MLANLLGGSKANAFPLFCLVGSCRPFRSWKRQYRHGPASRVQRPARRLDSLPPIVKALVIPDVNDTPAVWRSHFLNSVRFTDRTDANGAPVARWIDDGADHLFHAAAYAEAAAHYFGSTVDITDLESDDSFEKTGYDDMDLIHEMDRLSTWEDNEGWA